MLVKQCPTKPFLLTKLQEFSSTELFRDTVPPACLAGTSFVYMTPYSRYVHTLTHTQLIFGYFFAKLMNGQIAIII